MAASLRKRIKRRIRSALVRAAIRLLGMVPLVPALWLGAGVGRLAHALGGRTRRRALAHLAVAFPEKSDVEREAILIDQDTHGQGVFVPFFGRLAFTPRAAADLAIRFGAPVVVGSIHRKGPRPQDGHVLEVAEVPVSTDPPDREAEAMRLTAACTAALEAAIRRHPAEWVWMHERWKTRPAAAPTEAPQAKPVPKSAAFLGD